MKKDDHYFRREHPVAKKAELLTLVALCTMSISGAFSYASVKKVWQENGNDRNDILTPDGFDTDEDDSQSALGYVMNDIMSAKSLNINELDIVCNPGSASTQATIALKNLGVDLSKLNTTSLSAQGDMSVSFGGKDNTSGLMKDTLTTSMHFALEDLTTMYLSAFSGKFKLSAPRTIAQVSSLINRFTPDSTDKPAKTSNNTTDIMSIVSKVKDVLSGTDSSIQMSLTEGKDFIDVTLGDLSFGETGKTVTIISGLKIRLGYQGIYEGETLKGATLTSLSVGSKNAPIQIRQQFNGNEIPDVLASLYIETKAKENSDESAVNVDKAKGLTLQDHSSYTDMTDPNQSVFSTIGDLFMKGTDGIISSKANIGLDVDIQKDNADFLDFNGSLKFDASNVKSFLSTSKMLLEVNNVRKTDSETKTLDSLKMYYSGGSTGSAYVNLDDSYKVRIDNTASDELVSYLSEGNGKVAIDSIISQLSSALNSVPSDIIKDSSTSGNIQDTIDRIADFIYQQTGKLPSADLNQLIKFEYFGNIDSKSGKFVFSLRKDLLGMKKELTNDATDWMTVTISLTTDKVTIVNGKIDSSYSGRIQNVVVSGIEFSGMSVAVTLDLKDLTKVDIDASQFANDKSYVSINGTVGIIKTLGNYFVDRKGGVEYALTYLPEAEDRSSFSLSGGIGVDLSEVKSFSTLGNSNGVLGLQNSQFYFSGRVATENTVDSTKNHSRNLSVDYKKADDGSRNLYFAYDDCFKNYISNSSITDICNVLESKTEEQAEGSSDAMVSMDKVLSLLSVSEKFQNDLKSIVEDRTLNSLKSFLSVRQGSDEDKVILDLNVGYIFEGSALASSVSSIQVIFDASTEKFNSITVGGYRTSGKALLEFTVNFGDFSFTNTDFSGYTEIKDATSIFNSFYNLPTTLDEYGIGIKASLTDKTKNQELLGLKSGLVIDKVHNNYDGAIVLSHPSLSNLDGNNNTAKQKIEFAYDSMVKEGDSYVGVQDPTFVAEYNDRMHIMLGKSSVKDLVGTISNDKSTHVLLEALGSLDKVANGLPIQSAIQFKDASQLLENRLIKSVSFDDVKNTITLSMFATLFNSEAKEDDTVDVVITYQDGTDAASCKLNSIALKDLTVAGKAIEASISMEESHQATLDNTVKSASGENASFFVSKPGDEGVKFINLADFGDLIKSGIDTTDFNYYSLKGNVSLDLTAWLQQSKINIDEFSFDLSIEYTMFIADGSLYMDLYVERENGEFADFKFADDYVYVVSSNTEGSVENNNLYKAYRMTKKDAKNEILYLALSETLDIDSHIAGRTLMAQLYDGFGKKEEASKTKDSASEGSTSSSLPLTLGISDDFSSILKETTIKSTDQKTGLNRYNLSLDLNSLFTFQSDLTDLVSFGKTELDIFDMIIRSKNDDDEWVQSSRPIYGIRFETNVNLLPKTYGENTQVASIRLGASLHANYTNNKDGFGVINDDSLRKLKNSGKEGYTDRDNLTNVERGVSEYFASINAINASVKDDFRIDRKELLSKELYDFSSQKLIEFYNDYRLISNHSASSPTMVYFNQVSDYCKNR